MADTLAGNLQRVLREDLGGTYGVSVAPEFTKRPTEEYRADDHLRLRSGAHAGSRQGAVRAWSTNSRPPVRARQVADVQAALRRDLETDSRQNGHLLNQLAYAYQYDEPMPDPATLRGLYEQLTPPLLRDAARTYLDTNRYVKVVLFPDAK